MNLNKQTVNNREYKIREFSSISELISYIKRPDNGYFPTKNSQDRDFEFRGTHTYNEALELLNSGWTEAAEKMNKQLALTPAQKPRTSPRPTYGVAGYAPSVPRFLQGIPTNMVTTKNVVRKQPVVTITRGITYNCGTSKETIMKEGVKALEVIRTLESRMIQVRLNILYCSYMSDREITGFKVCIKEPGERLNISKMAFPLAHVAMQRRIGLRYFEVNEDATVGDYGYGMPYCNQTEQALYPGEMYIDNFVDRENFLSKF